jgi:hypothetical protein
MAGLSKAQFQGLAEGLEPHGEGETGFTVKHTTGKSPKKGYAVSLAGSEKELKRSDITGNDIEEYSQRHNESLGRRGVYVGAWSPDKDDPEHGKTFLDNTQVIHSRHKATDEMVMENQRSMYPLGGEHSIPNVYRQEPKSFEEPKGFDRPKFERDVANTYRQARGRRALEADEKDRAGR